jgi:hypothetical protein
MLLGVMFRKAGLILTVFLLYACTAMNVSSGGLVNGKPAWFWTPNEGELLGGVGEAGTHIDGLNAQRQLAVSRAIEDIARQKGVTVSSIQTVKQQATETSSSTSLDVYSIQTVSGITVTARVREFWVDPQTRRLLVWITEVK